MKTVPKKSVSRLCALRVARLLKEYEPYFSEVVHSLALDSLKTREDSNGKILRVIDDDFDRMKCLSLVFIDAMALLFHSNRQPWTVRISGKKEVFSQDQAIRSCLQMILGIPSPAEIEGLVQGGDLPPVISVLQQFKERLKEDFPGYFEVGPNFSAPGLVVGISGESHDRPVFLYQVENDAVQLLREQLCSPAFGNELSQWGRQVSRNAKRARAHFTRLIEHHGSLIAIPLTLGYLATFDIGECMLRIFEDAERFFTNYQRNRGFEHLAGFVVAIEAGGVRIPCLRTVVYMRIGQNANEFRSSLIEHWKKITGPYGTGGHLRQTTPIHQATENFFINKDDLKKQEFFLGKYLSCVTGSLAGVHSRLPTGSKNHKLFRLSRPQPAKCNYRQRARRSDLERNETDYLQAEGAKP